MMLGQFILNIHKSSQYSVKYNGPEGPDP